MRKMDGRSLQVERSGKGARASKEKEAKKKKKEEEEEEEEEEECGWLVHTKDGGAITQA